MNKTLVLLCAAALLGACSEEEEYSPTMTEITGTVAYRERMLPPPGAALEVVLEDVSRADAPATEMIRTLNRLTTAPPYPIAISVDSASIVANHRYNIRARIFAGSDLLFVSDTANPVFGPGNVVHVDIVLRRASGKVAATSPSEQHRGMYSYTADAGWFVDCRSGARLPVATEGDNAALERAYTSAREMAGAPMLATVQGRVEELLPMEGLRPVPTLVVDKFISVEAQGCSGPASQAELENTYWKLMTLYGKNVETREGAREIHFVLNSQTLRLSGFSGCNGISDQYRIDGEMITFSGMAGTLMACTAGMDIERQIHDMFPEVTAWKISGETLQLTNSSGAQIATFESRYLK
jgi:uncharacterized lipoprotein YbaY/heat shock protein HslJ